jgi:hypothetical protein
VRPEQEEDDQLFKLTEDDTIPGTGVFCREPEAEDLPNTGSRSFLLLRQSLIHWEQLWRFTVEAPFALASVNEEIAQLHVEKRSKNTGDDAWKAIVSVVLPSRRESPSIFLSVNAAFILYGGLHLLAWEYQFHSTAEAIMWKMAGVCTASSGMVASLLSFGYAIRSLGPMLNERLLWWLSNIFTVGFQSVLLAYIPVNMFARTYLFVESFVVLPNSPPSTYQIPPWTAYVPHI